MPRAIPQRLREEIVWRRLQGQTLPAIARAVGVKEGTVRVIWRRYRERGDAGLAHNYARCGRPGPRFPAALHQAALALKREHPEWSARRVWLELRAQYPAQPLPGPRTLQRWFQMAGL